MITLSSARPSTSLTVEPSQLDGFTHVKAIKGSQQGKRRYQSQEDGRDQCITPQYQLAPAST